MSSSIQIRIEWHFPSISPFTFFFCRLIHLLKYYFHVKQKIEKCHLHRVDCWCKLGEKKWSKDGICGTPALTGNHSDVGPFSRSLWNLLYKKLSIRLNRESETPNDLSLNISLWCQTLSKALGISINKPEVSIVG